jgi:hypothetical protein
MRYILGLLLIWLTGCNTIELDRIRTKEEGYLSIQTQIERNFTPEARAAIQGIKVYEGLHINSYVVGVNFWSDFISFLTFNGIGRKIITSQGTLSECTVSTIIHEYAHHIDDMDRDREIEAIDHLEFWRAFLQMRTAPATQAACDHILNKSNHFITNVFGIGLLSEAIAYTASWIVENPDLCPMYMHRVFANILAVSRSKLDL